MSGTRHQYGIKQHEQRRKKNRQMRCLITIVAVCIVLILAYMIAGVLRKKAVLTLQFENVAILQGEDVPTLKAKVKVEKDDGPTLDKKSKYTSKDFIRDLKKGKGYKIICKVDPKTEGSYKATIKLSESLQKKLDNDWSKKIQLTVKDGKVRVKNKVGRWEKNKFKRYDGTYVKSDFVVSRGDTYYFDETFLDNNTLKIKKLTEYNKEWAEFLCKCRLENYNSNHDIIYDRMADSKFKTLSNYIERYYFGQVSLKTLLLIAKFPKNRRYNQYCFKTERAIEKLILIKKEGD